MFPHMLHILLHQEPAASPLTRQSGQPKLPVAVVLNLAVKSAEKKNKQKKKHLFSLSQGAASTPGSATRSTRFWERGCGVHSKMRNVTAGQCEAQDSVLPLGTRPQAVCFCRNILNCPCTYVNTEHQDARSHHSERCRDGSHPLEASIQFI